MGAAYGTAKSGVGISSMGVMNADAVMKNIIPVVMAGVLGIYGLIIAVILVQGSQRTTPHPHLPPFTLIMSSPSLALAHLSPLPSFLRL